MDEKQAQNFVQHLSDFQTQTGFQGAIQSAPKTAAQHLDEAKRSLEQAIAIISRIK